MEYCTELCILITHGEAETNFDFTPTCYKIRTQSIQTIKTPEFPDLASVGGNALHERVRAFKKIFSPLFI